MVVRYELVKQTKPQEEEPFRCRRCVRGILLEARDKRRRYFVYEDIISEFVELRERQLYVDLDVFRRSCIRGMTP